MRLARDIDFSLSGGVHHLPRDPGEQRAVLVSGEVPGQVQRVRDQSQRADGDEVGCQAEVS